MPSRTHPSATTRVPSPGQHGHRERALTQSQPARVGQTADALVLKDGDHFLLCTESGDAPVRIAAGLRAYGRDAEALTLASALFDAASGFRDYRLPELFELKGLRLGTGSVDLRVERRSDGTIHHHSRSTRIAVVRAAGGRRGAR